MAVKMEVRVAYQKFVLVFQDGQEAIVKQVRLQLCTCDQIAIGVFLLKILMSVMEIMTVIITALM